MALTSADLAAIIPYLRAADGLLEARNIREWRAVDVPGDRTHPLVCADPELTKLVLALGQKCRELRADMAEGKDWNDSDLYHDVRELLQLCHERVASHPVGA